MIELLKVVEVDTGNFVGNLQPNPRYQGGIGGKITDTWGSNEPPMVEYTPPFYGGMAAPPGGNKPSNGSCR